jgi:hypothetical protein
MHCCGNPLHDLLVNVGQSWHLLAIPAGAFVAWLRRR